MKLFLSLFSAPNLPPLNEDDLPILPLLKSFDLQIPTIYDINLLSLILRCMPTLREFSFTYIEEYLDPLFIDTFIDGNHWQQILTNRVPYLNQFNFHISFITEKNNTSFDLDWIVDSFRCFLTQYAGWHMAASQWQTFKDSIPCK